MSRAKRTTVYPTKPSRVKAIQHKSPWSFLDAKLTEEIQNRVKNRQKVQEKLKQGPNYSQGLNVSHLVEVPDLDRPVVGAAVQRVRFLPEHETGNWIAVAPEGVDALEVVAGAWTDLPDVNESTVVACCLQCGRDFGFPFGLGQLKSTIPSLRDLN